MNNNLHKMTKLELEKQNTQKLVKNILQLRKYITNIPTNGYMCICGKNQYDPGHDTRYDLLFCKSCNRHMCNNCSCYNENDMPVCDRYHTNPGLGWYRDFCIDCSKNCPHCDNFICRKCYNKNKRKLIE